MLIAIFLVLVAANVYYYLNIYKQQIDFQKNILYRQTEICSWEIEQHVSNFMNEINFILFTEDISQFFDTPETQSSSIRKIEVFLSKYKQLVTSITLFNKDKEVFSIFKDRNNKLISDIYISREQKDLLVKEKFEESAGEFIFTLPYFRDKVVLANLVVKIDTKKYVESVFSNYHISNTLWQWFINNEGEVFFSNFRSEIINIHDIDQILPDNAGQDADSSIIHQIETEETIYNVISTFYPIKVMDRDMLVVFSIDTSIVVSQIVNSIITIAAATFIVLLLVILFFLYFIRNEQKEKQKSKASENAIKDIFESLPMGIIIKGDDNRIKMINITALRILKINDSDSVLGKDFSNMFFLFRDYPGNGAGGKEESTSEYVYYDTDENELILYKKEIPAVFLGKKVFVEAFIDISPIEQARKNEYIFGEAKTEFLKRVSHDILNPLNGILNMANSLESELNPGRSGTEKINLIRHCCEDILLVVNDIMDFSTFDDSNTLVEEIPFILPDEIDMVIKPLLNKASEKEIEIKTEILENVPKNLIGDPFHIKQVITNLLSNSLKYTQKGIIKLTIGSKSQSAGNIRLNFTVEDTGSGISTGLLEELNRRENIQNLISADNPGLNKTRQLINLMKGDMVIESPAYDITSSGGPGTRVKFHIQVYSNEVSWKSLNFDHITSYKDIRALVLAESVEKSGIQTLLKKLGISCETTLFNDSTIDNIKIKLTDTALRYSIIVIIDSERSNGFSIARHLHENHLDENFLIIIVSSVNKPGNFIKSRRFGADHYLIEPFDASEIFDIIQNNFLQVAIPVSEKTKLKKVKSDLNILVAEDNHVNQIVAQSLFKSLGYNIDIVSNGKEAVEKVREKEYDIIFMDIRMPGKNGLDATYEIRKNGYNMPIVAMTANVGETSKTEAIEVGMNDFIAKPVRIDALKNIIIKKFSKKDD